MMIICFSMCQEKQGFTDLKIISENQNLKLVNGTLLYNNVPFTGILAHYDELNLTNNETRYSQGRKDGVEVKKIFKRYAC